MSLRAFAVFEGATGTINRSSGVSACVRNSIGNYTITLTPAMPNAVAICLFNLDAVGGARMGVVLSLTATSINFITSPSHDPRTGQVAIYG